MRHCPHLHHRRRHRRRPRSLEKPARLLLRPLHHRPTIRVAASQLAVAALGNRSTFAGLSPESTHCRGGGNCKMVKSHPPFVRTSRSRSNASLPTRAASPTLRTRLPPTSRTGPRSLLTHLRQATRYVAALPPSAPLLTLWWSSTLSLTTWTTSGLMSPLTSTSVSTRRLRRRHRRRHRHCRLHPRSHRHLCRRPHCLRPQRHLPRLLRPHRRRPRRRHRLSHRQRLVMGPRRRLPRLPRIPLLLLLGRHHRCHHRFHQLGRRPCFLRLSETS